MYTRLLKKTPFEYTKFYLTHLDALRTAGFVYSLHLKIRFRVYKSERIRPSDSLTCKKRILVLRKKGESSGWSYTHSGQKRRFEYTKLTSQRECVYSFGSKKTVRVYDPHHIKTIDQRLWSLLNHSLKISI